MDERMREVQAYLAPTSFGARMGIVLGRRLMTSAPDDLTGVERRALRRVREATERLHERTKARLEVRPADLVRLSRQIASAWVGARSVLEGLARCAEEATAKEARALRAAIIPASVRFVAMDFTGCFTVSAQLLDRIEERGLDGEVARLVHPSFLPRLRALHAEFADLYGMGDTPFRAPRRELPKHISALADAIVAWAIALAGRIDPEDAESVGRFFFSMAPLAEHRRVRRLQRGGGESPEIDGEQSAGEESAATDVESPDVGEQSSGEESAATDVESPEITPPSAERARSASSSPRSPAPGP